MTMTHDFEAGSVEPAAIIPQRLRREPVEMIGLAEKVGNAVGAKELLIAMQAADAWATNAANARHLARDQVNSIAQKAQHEAHMACKRNDSPQDAANAVDAVIAKAIEAAEREAA